MNTISFSYLHTPSDIDLRDEVAQAVRERGELLMRVNALVARRVSGMRFENVRMLHYDSEEPVTDGTVVVRLVDLDSRFALQIKHSKGEAVSVDNTGVDTRGEDFMRLIIGSDWGGNDPRDLMIQFEDALTHWSDIVDFDGRLTMRYEGERSMRSTAFDPMVGTYAAVSLHVPDGDKIATAEDIALVDPMLRASMLQMWTPNHVNWVWSKSEQSYIPHNRVRYVITSIDLDGNVIGDFMNRLSMQFDVMTVFNRHESLHNLTLISVDAARLVDGVLLTNGMQPLIADGEFHFDVSHRDIVYRLGYHDYHRDPAEPLTSGMTIGFEIEKEDEDELRGTCARELYHDTGWSKERDSSLDDDSGYELVSPIYDLMSDKLDRHIKGDNRLELLINADHSHRCGGHIHVGHSDYSGRTLFDKVSPWVPLLYSLYVGRIGRDYCAVKKNDEIKQGNDKYQAVRIFDDHIEFRIISAVPDVTTLLWRRDLMRIIMTNLDYSPMKIVGELLDEKSKLYEHLRKNYAPAKIATKAKLYAYFAAELLDDAHAVREHIMNAIDHFSQSQLRHLKNYSFNVDKQ
jgi:hypothetical protein